MRTISVEEAKRLVAEGEHMTVAQRAEVRRQRLRELVNYARENSPYFAKLYANIPEDFDLSDLPTTEKPVLVANFDDWVTDRRINKEMVSKYLERDAEKDRSLLLDEYTALHTSGSTGNPLLMVRDDFHNKIHAQLIGQRLLKGTSPDMLSIAKHRRASVISMAKGASSYSAFLRIKANNPEHAHNLLGINAIESVDSIVKKLNDFQPETMAGYPSMVVQLAVEQLQGRLHISLKHLVTSAETLTEENWQLLREAFQCPVGNNYCMTEGGEVAMTHNCPHLHINDDWVIVEPVDADRNPITDPEEWSQGVLITDLSNFIQPVIRYYVNDMVRILPSDEPCSNMPILKVQGRTFPMFTAAGKKYSVAGLYSKAKVWPDLVNFQFVQKDDTTLEVRGVCKSDPAQVLPSLCVRLKEFMEEMGCPEARFTWSTEPLIPNKRGGKIPLYYNNQD